jgi:preprotein translocase subunit SecE
LIGREEEMIDVNATDISAKPEVKRPKIGTLIREYKEELKKVSWTTKEELIFFTKIVVITTFAFGIGIYVVDLVIKGVLQLIGRLVHF